jgi:hypothetical protein
VFNLAALMTSKEVILCEALIDALTFWCAGYRNVTAAYGIEGFTEGHIAAFKRHGTERVLIAYDRDDWPPPATATTPAAASPRSCKAAAPTKEASSWATAATVSSPASPTPSAAA